MLEGPHLLFRYELFYQDLGVIWKSVRESLGIAVSPSKRRRIQRKFSLEANRRRAEKLKDFNEVGEYQIHGDHIGPADPGTWKESLPIWAVDLVREECAPIAERWGYAD